MFAPNEIQSYVLESGLVDACTCIVASNGTLTLQLVRGDSCFVVAGLARNRSNGSCQHLINEIRTAVDVAVQRPHDL
jgi:hypothetical protein